MGITQLKHPREATDKTVRCVAFEGDNSGWLFVFTDNTCLYLIPGYDRFDENASIHFYREVEPLSFERDVAIALGVCTAEEYDALKQKVAHAREAAERTAYERLKQKFEGTLQNINT